VAVPVSRLDIAFCGSSCHAATVAVRCVIGPHIFESEQSRRSSRICPKLPALAWELSDCCNAPLVRGASHTASISMDILWTHFFQCDLFLDTATCFGPCDLRTWRTAPDTLRARALQTRYVLCSADTSVTARGTDGIATISQNAMCYLAGTVFKIQGVCVLVCICRALYFDIIMSSPVELCKYYEGIKCVSSLCRTLYFQDIKCVSSLCRTLYFQGQTSMSLSNQPTNLATN
jgi:hypothetical protein